MDLYDSRGLDPGPEDVLLRGLVVLGAQALQVVQEAGRERVSLKKCFHIDLSLCKYSNKTSKRERYDNDFFRSRACDVKALRLQNKTVLRKVQFCGRKQNHYFCSF